jgi:hypothetical protein
MFVGARVRLCVHAPVYGMRQLCMQARGHACLFVHGVYASHVVVGMWTGMSGFSVRCCMKVCVDIELCGVSPARSVRIHMWVPSNCCICARWR